MCELYPVKSLHSKVDSRIVIGLPLRVDSFVDTESQHPFQLILEPLFVIQQLLGLFGLSLGKIHTVFDEVVECCLDAVGIVASQQSCFDFRQPAKDVNELSDGRAVPDFILLLTVGLARQRLDEL